MPTGRFQRCGAAAEPYLAFIPAPLPPDPPVEFDFELQDLYGRANRAIGRLDEVTDLLPDTAQFLYLYVRKEAVLSSQIEGTQSSLSDLIRYERDEIPGVPIDDVKEVSQYVAAMEHGLARLREGFPLSNRLIREMHAILLSKGRGSTKAPGEFRRSQNWIGGSRPGNAAYVPPPPEAVPDCMGDLEKFLHGDPVRTPVPIKAALAHVQFETIHPFLDGNGRIGRLIVTLLLCAEGALRDPILYLSLYFKTHRQEYYEKLQAVRKDGGWRDWLVFFLTGIEETARQAVDTARRILTLFDEDRQIVQGVGRTAGSVLQVHRVMQRRLIATVPELSGDLDMSEPTIRSSLNKLEELGMVNEMTGNKRNRLYLYRRYLEILNEGAEPLAPGE